MWEGAFFHGAQFFLLIVPMDDPHLKATSRHFQAVLERAHGAQRKLPTPCPPYFISYYRVSTYCRGLNLFTREEQGLAFKAAYKDLPVHTTSLSGVGNFKAALICSGRVPKIPGIQAPRSFEVLKLGTDEVSVGMKESMHRGTYTGVSVAGVLEGPPHVLFDGGVPVVEEAPSCPLKDVPERVQQNVRRCYDAVHSRVDALFPSGELATEQCVELASAFIVVRLRGGPMSFMLLVCWV